MLIEESGSSSTPFRDSGATGGAATGRGVDYQTDLAVYYCLDLISKLLAESPTARQWLQIEPRLLSPEAVTRWDFCITPANEHFEAKSNPKRKDIEEYIRRVAQGVSQNQKSIFHLIVGEVTNSHTKALRKLIRLVGEENQSSERFRQLCKIEDDPAFRHLLDVIKPDPMKIASRMRFECLSEESLKIQIAFRLRYLVNPSDAETVKDYLRSQFLTGMTGRKSYFIPELMKKLQDKGVTFRTLSGVLPNDLDEPAHAAIFVLQRCLIGLPIDVVRDVCMSGMEQQYCETLRSLPEVLIPDGNLLYCSPLPARLDHPNEGNLLGRTLSQLIAFVKANRGTDDAIRQVPNALTLARACVEKNPKAAAQLFGPLDKFLKRLGRKRDVFEAARITLEAARRATPRDRADVEAEAKALVCGYSWVYQRTGELEKAESFTNESLAIGESIGWTRNTAFCHKCLGRLKRVQAERCVNSRRQSTLLNESATKLKAAVETFGKCEDFGPNHEEVGDCHSLLSRTYLSMRKVADAENHATLARGMITDQNSKDYMDLLILEGDLGAEKLHYQLADSKYAEAISLLNPDDAEKSEIVARAYFSKGENLRRWKGDDSQAIALVEMASEIWKLHGEHHCLGVAHWKLLEMRREVPKPVLRRLRDLDPSVAVEVVRLTQGALSSRHEKTLAQRDDMPDAVWAKMIQQAKENNAIRHSRW